MHVFIYAIINNSNLNNYLACSLLIIILITIPIFTYGNSELNCADYADEYDNVGHETVKKMENKNHTAHIRLCWIVTNEIYVGELITIYAKVDGSYYNNRTNINNITIMFPNELINYWDEYSNYERNQYISGPYYENITKIYQSEYIEKNAIKKEKFEFTNMLTLYPNVNHTSYKSEPINFRFIVPEIINIEYCEYKLIKQCHIIKNIIKPAPYDLKERIYTNKAITDNLKITFFLSIITIILTSILTIIALIDNDVLNLKKELWSKLYKNNKKSNQNEYKTVNSNKNIRLESIENMPMRIKSWRYRIFFTGLFSFLTMILIYILITILNILKSYE